MISTAAAAQADLATLKEHLRISFVMNHYGQEPECMDHRSLSYRSPFRDDEHPSFDVFYHTISGRDEPEERWGDRGETLDGRQGTQGDVVDLIQRFEPGMSRAEAIMKARDLLVEMIEEGWDGPVIVDRGARALDLSQVEMLQDLGRPLYGSGSSALLAAVQGRPGLIDVELPRDRVFMHPQHDTIVYLLKDEAGEVRGARFRNADGDKWALSGSANILLRMGAPAPSLPVLLCEGETDTWAAWSVLGEEFEVLGVPGVGNPPASIGGQYLTGRTVFIAFDPDDAGRGGQEAWTSYLHGVGADVRVIVLPTGKDIASLYPAEIAELPGRARHMPPAPAGFVRQGAQFGTLTMSKGEPVFNEKSNWAIEPKAILVGESGERSYTGRLLPHNVAVTLPAAALTSAAQLRSWGQPHQARWYGSDADVQRLAALLDNEAALLPEGRCTDQVGLYEGTFVWPRGSLGLGQVEYVEGEASPGYTGQQIFLQEEPVNRIAVFEALYYSQAPGVTGPMIAWSSAAPLRIRFPRFPVLSVAGMSGTGKSTLTEVFLSTINSVNIALNLTSSTAYGVETMIDTSNGLPVWFDEYRPGARDDAKTRLDQLLRDAYTGQESRKGGAESNRNRLRRIRTFAPIVVSGEDDFTETSHTDRMVLVRLDETRQGDLGAVERANPAGFGYAYLSSLLRAETAVEEPPVLTTPALPELPNAAEGLRPRQVENLRVLLYGWQLMEAFLREEAPDYEMPVLDLSEVMAAATGAAATSPVLDLITLCYENSTSAPTVWEQDGRIMVHPANTIQEAGRHKSIILPTTTARGLRAILTSPAFGGEDTRATPPVHISGSVSTPRLRVISLPLDTIDLDTDRTEL